MKDEELKKEFESPRGQKKFALIASLLSAIGAALFCVLLADPFEWLTGPPAVHEAKKWVLLTICFVVVPILAGFWFMIIRPLQTGIVTGGSKYRAPYCILRSEEQSRFRAHIRWNCVLLTTGFALCVWLVVGSVRDVRRAQETMSTGDDSSKQAKPRVN